MKTIGLLGGMSWESTVSYYQSINRQIKQTLGGLHSAKIVLYSVDFAEIEELQKEGNWDKAAELLSDASKSLQAAGAEGLFICTNTMHIVAPQIQSSISIPLFHIADATAEVLVDMGVKKVGLLGTKFTMQEGFYKNRISEHYGIEVIVPDEGAQEGIHTVIYDELCLGEINPHSKDFYLDVIEDLKNKGVEAIILGCTEIALLVNAHDTTIPLLDTTTIHASKAVTFALEG
ncbi:aspartate/glutamate racemase family protein [Pseudoalteromonas xiamenensis]|uniref:aspartate/glutamate racemase family protein n=1 Tax=Pseudoalteromonas xiamenensis TaxID=882626 RepID=UPI0027E40A78|nr:aspartate/glutamate racemase family protein [Pseudoalteromonas xiamenensis]WMN60118.1 aspartate/glutamate racemase family protein [Pseudoalteromonas xiamenensis]